MSQAGYTPIQLYYSTTAAATPSAGNLAAGELAVNITDGKLFYKDNGGVVRVLATAAGSAGDVVGPGSSTDNALVRFDGTTGKLVQNSAGVLSDAGVLTGLTGLTSSGSITFSGLTAGRVTYAGTGGLLQDSANLTFDGTTLTANALTVSNAVTLSGGTANGVAYLNGSKVLTSGSALTFDGTRLTSTTGKFGGGVASNSASLMVNNATNTATGIQLFQDGIESWIMGMPANSAGLAWSASGTEQMRLTSTGLGIGTSSPGARLDVYSSGTTSTLIRTRNDTTSVYLDANNGYSYLNTFSNHPMLFGTNNAERMRIDASGNVGIGTSSPGTYSAKLAVVSTAADTRIAVIDDTSNGRGGYLRSNYSDAVVLGTTSGVRDLVFAPDNTERARISTSGNLLVGTTSGSKLLTVQGGSTGGVSVQAGFGGINATSFQIYHADAGGQSSAATVANIAKVASTNRSINAAGTINASGADYAEYMTKAGEFTVAKGDVVGIDSNGELTNVFSDAVSFCVKSTAPSYVGGDTWGAELEGDELEAARQKVDRIAFAGQVPVNVIGATAGQYIIPVEDNGAIAGQAVSNPTFEQYQIAVGKVIAIESDGRARIIVKVA